MPPHDRSLEEWRERLQHHLQSLHGLSGSSEEEFLAIGSHLQHFSALASENSRKSAELVALIDSGEIARGMKELEGILLLAEEGLGQVGGGNASGAETLRQIGVTLQEMDEPLNSFNRINKVLRMLAISTKIESARLGEEAAGFDSLANDVTRLAEVISDKSEALIRKKSDLDGVIQQTLATVQHLGGAQLQRLHGLVTQIQAGMATFAGINARFSQAASSVASVSIEIHRTISDIVASLQFHDITRQKLEHVQEALSLVCRRFGDTQSLAGSEAAVQEHLYVEVAAVCRLQAAQLRDARVSMVSAVAAIVEGLRGIAEREGDMCHDLGQLSGSNDTTGSSFFTEMTQSLVAIVTALKESDASSRQSYEAMGGVAARVGEMASFAGHIEQVGEEIELIALNAQVKAARTGNFGAALGVLAESIQRLSEDARRQSGSISGALREIIERAEGLSSCAEDGRLFDGKLEEITGHLDGLLTPLQTVHRSIVTLFAQLETSVMALRHDIEAVIAGVTVHERLAQAMDEVTAGLERIDSKVCSFAKAKGWDDFTVCLDNLAGCYTMESERRIHDAMAGLITGREYPGGSGEGDLPVRSHREAADSGDEFGDNVELF